MCFSHLLRLAKAIGQHDSRASMNERRKTESEAEELFLWHGADPNHQDELRRSALDYARLRQPEASSALQALLRGSWADEGIHDVFQGQF